MIHVGDCREILRTLPDASVDSVVTDPPYELGFMGKAWDGTGIANDVGMWREVLRVLKPGGHLLAFSGSRTYHRMVCAIEDAGFEIRDQIMWLYGSGFPKSLDVSKAIDKAAGAEREVIGIRKGAGMSAAVPQGAGTFRDDAWTPAGPDLPLTTPATDAARQWQGWGTALKPAHEPIVVARKPLIGTVAANVLAHGTGALNIDGCRVGDNPGWSYPNGRGGSGWHGRDSLANNLKEPMAATQGRWPAHVIHDGSDEVLDAFPSSSVTGKRSERSQTAVVEGTNWLYDNHKSTEYTDSGSAARFFYCAKASREDRDDGCEHLPEQRVGNMQDDDYKWAVDGKGNRINLETKRRNVHPTVKPTALMRYLVRLVTPPGGTVLDPFTGSGSTGRACALEGFEFIGCELSADYIAIANARIEAARREAAAEREAADAIDRQHGLFA